MIAACADTRDEPEYDDFFGPGRVNRSGGGRKRRIDTLEHGPKLGIGLAGSKAEGVFSGFGNVTNTVMCRHCHAAVCAAVRMERARSMSGPR